jgi:hypothetical protein
LAKASAAAPDKVYLRSRQVAVAALAKQVTLVVNRTAETEFLHQLLVRPSSEAVVAAAEVVHPLALAAQAAAVLVTAAWAYLILVAAVAEAQLVEPAAQEDPV